jgi:hypothetical protein
MNRQEWFDSIAPGLKVWWNDPEGIANGHYVVRAKKDSEATAETAIVVIVNARGSEAEVPVFELTVDDLGTIFPKADWQYEVANGGTHLSLEDWRSHQAESCEWPAPEPRVDEEEETIEVRWILKVTGAETRQQLRDFAEQLERDLGDVIDNMDGACVVVKDTGDVCRKSSKGDGLLHRWEVE